MNYGIGNVKGKTGAISNNGAYFVDLTNATESSGTYTIPSADIENGDFTLQVGDMLIDKNSGNLLKVATLTPDITADLVVEASSGGGGAGTPLYEHNIWISQWGLDITLQIINDDNTQFTLTKLKQFLTSNNIVYNVNPYECNGLYRPASEVSVFNRLGMNGNDMYVSGYAPSGSTGASIADSGGTFVDDIRELGTASINGGGSTQKYQHHITAKGTGSFSANVIITLTIENDDNTAFTALTLRQYLYENGFVDVDHLYEGGGRFGSSSPYSALVGLYATASTIMAYTTSDASDYISISAINDIVL